MFGSKYRATLKYKTHNNFIINRKDELRLGIDKLFRDINQEYNVEIIEYKSNNSTKYLKDIGNIGNNALSYDIILESKNNDDLGEVVDMLDKYVFDMFSIKDCKIEKV